MTTVPTELLQTLVAVVEFRSFTKAAQSLGVTQPAVSAQIKRLQVLLGTELFDKSAPGVTLTERGELVVNYAHRLLAINDRILNLSEPRAGNPPLRIGVPGDFAGASFASTFAVFRARYPNLRFQIRGDISENLFRDLRQGDLDLAVAFTTDGPALDARHHWREEMVWARGAACKFGVGDPVPLVTFGEGCVPHRLATTTLNYAGRDYDIVFTAFGQDAILAAVDAGLGVTLLPARSVPVETGLRDTGTLPKSPDMWGGIYQREGIDCQVIEELGDTMAATLRPRPEEIVPARVQPAWPAPASAPDAAVAVRAGSRS